MKIIFNGIEKKQLVKALGEALGVTPSYKYAPSFAYEIGHFLVDRDGVLHCGEEYTNELDELLEVMAEHGFESEVINDSETETPGKLAIEIPTEGFTELALENLQKIVDSKAGLIMKSIGVDRLPIIRNEDNLHFSWFPVDAEPGEIRAYTKLVEALCEMAKNQQRIVSKEKPVDNEKYAFRCFLLRLGFIGEEYASARKILLSKLSGSSAFKSGKRNEPDAVTVSACVPERDCLSCGQSMSEEGDSGADRLFCVVKQEYVQEDGLCSDFN